MDQSDIPPAQESHQRHMKQNLIPTGQWLVTALLLAIGLSAYGCADTASVSEDVAAPLASLTVTPGALQPSFFSNTTNYAVNAPTSATSVTVTAVPKDNAAIVKIDGVVTSQRSVTLGTPGSTKTILIVVETQTGLETTYTVTVTRLLSSDNNLSAMDVTPGELDPPFDPNTENYITSVGVLVDSVTVSATKSDPSAGMLIGSVAVPLGTASGQATISLGAPGTATLVPVEVTAPNGTKKTYRITVNRAAPSGDNNLSALTVTPGALNPPFDASTLTYTVNVAPSVTSVTVTATLSDTSASMMINGQGTSSGQARDINLGPPGPTPIEIVVTAPNGTPRTYTITVNRAVPSSDDKLLDLTVTPGSLIPAFEPNTPNYTVIVFSSITSVTVSATKSDPNSVMQIGSVTVPAGTISGQETFPLNGAGGLPTLLSVTVTAQNGIDSETYNIEVTRPFFP
jgi:hypothetical protein